MMIPWLIVSPEYGTLIPIVGGQGPMEYGCDVVHVEAETRADAIALGVKMLRESGARYIDALECSPYAGVKAFSQLCEQHGMPQWRGDHYECLQCEAEASAPDGSQEG
jgi:hypothetical protein